MQDNEAAPVNARKKAPPWKKGQSGNPRGMKTGSRHRTTIFLENLLSGESEELTRKLVQLAKEGDTAALKICMDRLLPPIKTRGSILCESRRLCG